MDTVSAQHRYVQLCRSLKTYGITFFSIKVSFIIFYILFWYLTNLSVLQKKEKKKLVPMLLGVTRYAILMVEPETKVI